MAGPRKTRTLQAKADVLERPLRTPRRLCLLGPSFACWPLSVFLERGGLSWLRVLWFRGLGFRVQGLEEEQGLRL